MIPENLFVLNLAFENISRVLQPFHDGETDVAGLSLFSVR